MNLETYEQQYKRRKVIVGALDDILNRVRKLNEFKESVEGYGFFEESHPCYKNASNSKLLKIRDYLSDICFEKYFYNEDEINLSDNDLISAINFFNNKKGV